MGIDFVLGLSSLEAVIIKTLQGLCNRWKTEYVTWGRGDTGQGTNPPLDYLQHTQKKEVQPPSPPQQGMQKSMQKTLTIMVLLGTLSKSV